MIHVNEVEISDDEIHREMQYHPAPNREQAEREAKRALLVRQILLQEAVRTGRIAGDSSGEAHGDEEASIASLLEENVRVDEPDEAACRALYARSGDRLRSPNLFEGSHILFLAPSDDEPLRVAARSAASETLVLLAEDPSRFEDLARERSDCSSAGAGGSLGQLRPGDTLPEFEAAHARLRDYLREERWREQFHAYLCSLASQMEIDGFDLEDRNER